MIQPEIIIGLPFAASIAAMSYAHLYREFALIRFNSDEFADVRHATTGDNWRQVPTTGDNCSKAVAGSDKCFVSDPLDGYDPDTNFIIHDEVDDEGYQGITFIQP